MVISLEFARELSGHALGFIAADHALVSALLNWSGMQVEDLRQAAGTPEFEQFLLEFLLQDDERVLAFAQSRSVKPEIVMQACEVLRMGRDP